VRRRAGNGCYVIGVCGGSLDGGAWHSISGLSRFGKKIWLHSVSSQARYRAVTDPVSGTSVMTPSTGSNNVRTRK